MQFDDSISNALTLALDINDLVNQFNLHHPFAILGGGVFGARYRGCSISNALSLALDINTLVNSRP